MISITKENIKSKYEFFKVICIEECLKYLKDSIPEVVTVQVINFDDDNHQLIEEMGGALCDMKYNKSVLICNILISEDIPKFNKTFLVSKRNRWEIFIKSLEIPIDEYSLFLIVLLHEFGHTNLIKLFHDADTIEDYTLFDSLAQSASTIFSRRRHAISKWEECDYHNELLQFVNGAEAQCDIFARDNFLPLWKIINKSLDKYTIGGRNK